MKNTHGQVGLVTLSCTTSINSPCPSSSSTRDHKVDKMQLFEDQVRVQDHEISQVFLEKFIEHVEPVLQIRNSFVTLLNDTTTTEVEQNKNSTSTATKDNKDAVANNPNTSSTSGISSSFLALQERCEQALVAYERQLDSLCIERNTYLEQVEATQRRDALNASLMPEEKLYEEEAFLADIFDELDDEYVPSPSNATKEDDPMQVEDEGEDSSSPDAAQPPTLLALAHTTKLELLQSEVFSRLKERQEKQEEEAFKRHVVTTKKSREISSAEISNLEREQSECSKIRQSHDSNAFLTNERLAHILSELSDLETSVRSFECLEHAAAKTGPLLAGHVRSNSKPQLQPHLNQSNVVVAGRGNYHYSSSSTTDQHLHFEQQLHAGTTGLSHQQRIMFNVGPQQMRPTFQAQAGPANPSGGVTGGPGITGTSSSGGPQMRIGASLSKAGGFNKMMQSQPLGQMMMTSPSRRPQGVNPQQVVAPPPPPQYVHHQTIMPGNHPPGPGGNNYFVPQGRYPPNQQPTPGAPGAPPPGAVYTAYNAPNPGPQTIQQPAFKGNPFQPPFRPTSAGPYSAQPAKGAQQGGKYGKY
ncbi:unnamed protein product [Amoebophrya sp. A25]|nr:unnamed protein product [Amoebophrya sp. A25]|eukprot:GSA25T00001601001.1